MNLAKILLGILEIYLLLQVGGRVGGWINVLIRVTSALFEVEIDVAFRPGLATFNQII